MKRFPLFLLLCFVSVAGIAQNPLNNPTTLQGWTERIDVQSRLLPQEITFVHMDNTGYFLGDTIFYKAYVVRSDNHQPSDMSGVMYAELLDNDGFLIERQILQLKDGQAWGSFCLNDTLYCGYYELRAYTLWQLNWGVYEHEHSKGTLSWFYNEDMCKEYYRDYEKLYSRVFPVYKKPEEAGKYTHDMVIRPLRRYFKTREEHPKANVSFYPEGGQWVEGLMQRIAFEACSEDGEHLDGKLYILEGEDTIATSYTEHRGRGVITLQATKENNYTAYFEWGKGISATDSMNTSKNRQKVDLPQRTKEGVVLYVEQSADSLCLNVSSTNLLTDSLAFTIMCSGVLQKTMNIPPPQNGGYNTRLAIPLDSLPTGITQVTVFDRNGRVWADRLTFVRHEDLHLQTIRFDDIKDSYEPYEKISVNVQGLPNESLSLAIRDKALAPPTNDSGTLLTEILLSSQIRGFVEHPEYYFEHDDEIHRRHLDLLLMVQGWRRYDWHTMTHSFPLLHPVERHRTLTGSVHRVSLQPKLPYDPSGIDHPKWNSLQESFLKSSSMYNNIGFGPVTKEGHRHFFCYEPYLHESSNLEESSKNEKIPVQRTDQLDRKPKDKLENEVLVHAEFIQNHGNYIVGDVQTDKWRFKIPLPDFQHFCLMHVAASDSTKWHHKFRKNKKGMSLAQYPWIAQEDEEKRDNLPEFYVRLYFPYPRFVKPYDYYQTTEPSYIQAEEERVVDAIKLNEIVVKSRRNGLRPFDRAHPAFKIDAYKAFNDIVDAGMHLPVYYESEPFMLAVAANYLGDMGVKNRAYTLKPRWNYYNESRFVDAMTLFHTRQLSYLDSIYVFTDYSPRKEGDWRYQQSNQPEVTIDMHLMPEGSQRITYRDRFYLLPGYNVCEEFYQPSYEHRPLPSIPKDYRRTLYWNPNLQLDENGHATISFWNNSRHNQLSVSAEGITKDGQMLTGR